MLKRKSMSGLWGLLWCFYKRPWCLIFPSVIVFGCSFWVFLLSFQLFENFYFGTLKLNSVHISQRFTVDSFGNYASCGQIEFSWTGSWEAGEIKPPDEVLRKSIFILIAKEGCANLDGDFPGWLPWSLRSLMVVYSPQTISHDGCGHKNCACDPWLVHLSQGLPFFPKLLSGSVPLKPIGAQIHIVSYVPTDFAPAIEVFCINTLKEN